jgi:hypothetical protein
MSAIIATRKNDEYCFSYYLFFQIHDNNYFCVEYQAIFAMRFQAKCRNIVSLPVFQIFCSLDLTIRPPAQSSGRHDLRQFVRDLREHARVSARVCAGAFRVLSHPGAAVVSDDAAVDLKHQE